MDQAARLIFEQVCKTLSVSEKQVMSKMRTRKIAEARFLCLYFIKLKNSDISLATIGRWFNRSEGGSPHSFAIYGIKQANVLQESDSKFKQKYLQCKDALNYYYSDLNFNAIPQY